MKSTLIIESVCASLSMGKVSNQMPRKGFGLPRGTNTRKMAPMISQSMAVGSGFSIRKLQIAKAMAAIPAVRMLDKMEL